jgi:hypothetical protein
MIQIPQMLNLKFRVRYLSRETIFVTRKLKKA